MSDVRCTLNVNATARDTLVRVDATLLDVLRENLELAGTKRGCNHADRFVPIGLVNPFYAFPAVDELLDEGFRSIKILTGWGNWLTIGNVRRVVVPITQALQRRSLHAR